MNNGKYRFSCDLKIYNPCKLLSQLLENSFKILNNFIKDFVNESFIIRSLMVDLSSFQFYAIHLYIGFVLLNQYYYNKLTRYDVQCM